MAPNGDFRTKSPVKSPADNHDPFPTSWQDISTAPRNGAPVDLWCGNSEIPRRVTDVQWREPTGLGWREMNAGPSPLSKVLNEPRLGFVKGQGRN